MTKCAVREPWPCENDIANVAGIGTIVCVRHMAGILAPPKDPFTVDERKAMRRPYERVVLGPQATKIALIDESMGLELVPQYSGIVRMPVGVPGSRYEVVGPTDPRVPRSARSAMLRGIERGFQVRATLVDGNLLVKVSRIGLFLAFTFQDGKFDACWLTTPGTIEQLGYRGAMALIVSENAS